MYAPIPNSTEMRPAVPYIKNVEGRTEMTSLLWVTFMHTIHRKHKNLQRYALLAIFITLRYSS